MDVSPAKTLAFVTLPSTVTGGQLHIFSIGVQTSGTSNWSQYLGNNADSSFNSAETTITPANVGNLKVKWVSTGNKEISDQPIVVNGTVYWGDYNGYIHATNTTTGVDLWKVYLGITIQACGTNGVTSSPNYQVINGVPTILTTGGGNDTFGGGTEYFYALNATTGALIWKTVVGSGSGDFPWASPLVYNGTIYYAMASLGDCPLTRDRIYKINETTGAITATFWTEPPGCTSAGIWGTPSIDSATGILYAATGTQSDCVGQPGDLSVSVIAVNTANMTLVSHWRIPNSQLIEDSDFGSAPTLFSAAINGVITPMVGIANKNGWYYAFNRNNISAGPVWEDQIAIGGTAPYTGGGSISPSSWDGTTLYEASGKATINGQNCNGSLSALNPANGAYLWRVCFTNANGWILGAVMEIPGMLFVNSGNTIQAFTTTGTHLFTYTDSSLYWGPLTVANGRVYDGDLAGNLTVLGL
jgi:polyvinyl alcohol dehydrogenase (cytochrome)